MTLIREEERRLTGKEQIDYKQFFSLAENHYGVRGNAKKLSKNRSTRHKEILLQPESGQQLEVEQSSGRSHECRVCQQFQECIRLLMS